MLTGNNLQMLALRYLFGYEMDIDPFHIHIVKTQFTRSLGLMFPAIHEEMLAAFEEYLPVRDGGMSHKLWPCDPASVY